MTDHDKDRWYWLRKENRKRHKDLSLWTCIKFTWSRNWDAFWQRFWYKLNRCPVCKGKIRWEWDGESVDGYTVWEGLMPIHEDEDNDCEGIC